MSTEAMMPISADALHYRTILFELRKPVTIPPQIFDEIWPYVDSKYECRLRKSRKSSVAQVADTDGKVIKRRQSSIRNANLCNVRIKVLHLVDGTAVTIERLDEHTHTHDIEESFQIKKPGILVGYIKSEAAKNYSASQIYHAIHSAGTHEGAERLKELEEKKQERREMRRSEKQKRRALQTQGQLNMEYNDVCEELDLVASDKFRIIFRQRDDEYEKQLIKDNYVLLPNDNQFGSYYTIDLPGQVYIYDKDSNQVVLAIKCTPITKLTKEEIKNFQDVFIHLHKDSQLHNECTSNGPQATGRCGLWDGGLDMSKDNSLTHTSISSRVRN
ncbi:hypothetical protein BGX38DRAFT_1267121 [Terfezia claveryi]|nr:hypothetical protein BGX38DRAFT_1267121 [Terfezia claveryi]